MKLLVITQKVDEHDAVLGFFHRWLNEFAKKFEFVTVICLGKGEYHVPSNVKVLSLGKESGASKVKYILNFYKCIWSERKNYDAVFVHMNQEYVLLGWKLWKLLGKKIYLWRNHKMGNWLTRFSVLVSDRVFCTSKGSFTAQFKKTMLMSVGIDAQFFDRKPEVTKIPHSVLLLTRISPVKHVNVFIESLNILQRKNNNFIAHIYGDPTPADEEYFRNIKAQAKSLAETGKLVFHPGVSNTKTPDIYNQHEIFVNLTDSGSFDKTIIEAMLCESLVLISNESLRSMFEDRYIFKDKDAQDLAQKLDALLKMSPEEKNMAGKRLRDAAKKHDLENLVVQLGTVIKS